ncbi:MAG: chorismate synthase [Oscillospiraceae bacterium]|nr:chorismate synthase [Oscillospiraceae bacterium]
MAYSFGGNLIVTLFGESHAAAVGVVLDGLPAGFEIDFDEIDNQLLRRKPAASPFSSQRKESDAYNILCGLGNGKTTGAVLAVMFKNNDAVSEDYVSWLPRPSSADYVSWIKYGGNGLAGGGQFSGRLTVGLVFAGAVVRQILERRCGVEICSHVSRVYLHDDVRFDACEIPAELKKRLRLDPMPVIDDAARANFLQALKIAKSENDSLGGCVEVAILGVKAGVGGPLFNSIESKISEMFFAIPAVKGIEFGNGFGLTKLKGSEANDSLYYDGDSVKTKTNNCGGICGGLANGMPIVFNVAFKPVPSIGKEQTTVNLQTKTDADVKICGRHDVSVVTRAAVIAESAAALVMGNYLFFVA